MHEAILTFAGLGLFFSGLSFLASSMQPLAVGKLRAYLLKMTKGPISSAISGSILGTITQSTSACSFICIGLVDSGALPFNRALSIIAWSSVGTSLLVFLVAVDVRLTGLFVIGLVGVAYLFNHVRHQGAKQLFAFVFALGLLFIGLGMIKDVSQTIRASMWAQELFRLSSQASIIGFLIGLIITLVVQSSSSVAMLAVTLNLAGLLSYHDVLMLIFGANIGSGLSVVWLTSHLKDQQRVLAFYLFIAKISGVLILFPISWLNQGWLQSLFPVLTANISTATEIAIIYLALQVTGAIAVSISLSPLLTALQFFIKNNESNQFFTANYIYPEAMEDPETAYALARKEQDRLILEFSHFLDCIRSDVDASDKSISLEERYVATQKLAKEIRTFMENAAIHNQTDVMIKKFFTLQSCNESIIALQDSLYIFVNLISASNQLNNTFANSMVESLHTVMTYLSESINEENADIELLLEMTSDKSHLMESIRNQLFSNQEINLADKQSLFISTNHFERIIWLVRQILNTRI